MQKWPGLLLVVVIKIEAKKCKSFVHDVANVRFSTKKLFIDANNGHYFFLSLSKPERINVNSINHPAGFFEFPQE
jgi:hypothetical protein